MSPVSTSCASNCFTAELVFCHFRAGWEGLTAHILQQDTNRSRNLIPLSLLLHSSVQCCQETELWVLPAFITDVELRFECGQSKWTYSPSSAPRGLPFPRSYGQPHRDQGFQWEGIQFCSVDAILHSRIFINQSLCCPPAVSFPLRCPTDVLPREGHHHSHVFPVLRGRMPLYSLLSCCCSISGTAVPSSDWDADLVNHFLLLLLALPVGLDVTSDCLI